MPSRVLRTYMDDDHCGGVGDPLVLAPLLITIIII